MTSLLPARPQTSTVPARAVAVRLEHVTKAYGARPAIDDVSLTIPTGSSVALVGANGAGKSTLLALLAGLLRPTSGRVTVHGCALEQRREASPRVGLLTHQTMLYDRLTGRENLVLHARLRGISLHRVDMALEQVGLVAAADRPAGSYSHGMRKRLALARVQLHEPDVLLLDEPFAGLDPDAQQRLARLLAALRGTTTILFTTHDLATAAAHADEVLQLDAGRVSRAGHPEDAGAEPADPDGASAPAAPRARPAGMLRTAWIVFRKDLTVEARGRATTSAVLILAGLLAVVLGMAFEPLAGNPRAVAGVLWVLVVFAALHGLTRSFDEDAHDDALRGVLLTGAEPAGVYLGRVASASVVLLAVALAALGAVAVLFAVPFPSGALPGLLVVLALAVLGLAAVGTVLTVIARHSPLGETLLPLLLLPLAVPVLLAGIESVATLLETGALDGGWLRILAFYAVGMLAASTIVFEHTVEG